MRLPFHSRPTSGFFNPGTRLAIALGLTSFASNARAQPTENVSALGGVTAPAEHDGQHDFDFLIGSWKIHLKQLVHPLTGSTTWVEFDGTARASKVLGGRANIDEVSVEGPSGKVEGLTLRMYSPQSRQWSIYWGSIKNGSLGQPVIPTVGSFKDGRGEFFDYEPINGRWIFVRYAWFDITPDSARFEQSFSADGGKTWEANWITYQTRIPSEPATP
jgi:hypothetical protein